MTSCKRKNKTFSMIKFERTVKPRYLPGEVVETVRQGDWVCYKTHRVRVARAVKKVDNAPPRLVPDVYYRTERMEQDVWNAMIRCRDNLAVVRNINTVWRTGGKVDCWNLKSKPKPTDRHAEAIYHAKTLQKENAKIYKSLQGRSSELSPAAMGKLWKVTKQWIIEKQRYPWFEPIASYPSISSGLSLDQQRPASRIRCYLDLEHAEDELTRLPLGRLVLELYAEHAPAQCANFEALCRGSEGQSYRGTSFRRILLDYYCQGGNVGLCGQQEPGNTRASRDSAPERASLPDERPMLRHTCPGVLTACSDVGLGTGFCLTFRPLRSLDGRYVVFGKVVNGLHNLLKVNGYGTRFGKPLQKVIIADCGVLTPTSALSV